MGRRLGWNAQRGRAPLAPRRLRRHLMALVALAALLLTIPAVGSAQTDGTVEIPLGTVVRTRPGVRTVLATLTVPAELVGRECLVESRAENNSSVHPGNDLEITSGGQTVVLADVEGTPGKVTIGAANVTLGDVVTVTLVMGSDGVFSAGASAVVVLQCTPTTTTTVATTTTSTPGSTTTTEPTTTVPSTTEPSSTTVPSTTVPSTTTEPSTTSTPGSTTSIAGPTTSIAGPTTSIAGPTTSVAGPTTTAPTDQPELAVTGPRETLLLLFVGLVLLDLGYLTVSATRPAPQRRRRGR